MAVIPRKVVVVPGQPQKHTEDDTCICTIIATVQAILPYKRAVMSKSRLVYIHTVSNRRLFL